MPVVIQLYSYQLQMFLVAGGVMQGNIVFGAYDDWDLPVEQSVACSLMAARHRMWVDL